MYRIIVCHNDELECIKCNKKIGNGNEFWGDSDYVPAPFHSPICKECYPKNIEEVE